MPGSVDHLRQYTSSYYTPFRFYAKTPISLENAPIIDLSASESANNNEIIIFPFQTNSISDIEKTCRYDGGSNVCRVDVYAAVNLESDTNKVIGSQYTWTRLMTIDFADGVMSSISPLFATYYKLVSIGNPTKSQTVKPGESSAISSFTINIANNDINMNGGQPSMVQQTFHKVSWQGLIDRPNSPFSVPDASSTPLMSISTSAGRLSGPKDQ